MNNATADRKTAIKICTNIRLMKTDAGAIFCFFRSYMFVPFDTFLEVCPYLFTTWKQAVQSKNGKQRAGSRKLPFHSISQTPHGRISSNLTSFCQ
jgi:hypothetical protein